MAKKKVVEIRNILSELLQKKGITINKIVIFGSYIKDKGRKDSDIDIIVVSENFRRKDIFEKVELTRGIHKELVRRTMKPFDLIYYSDEEWDSGHSLIINAAKENGEVIYG